MRKFLLFILLYTNVFQGSLTENTNLIHLKNNDNYFSEYCITENDIIHHNIIVYGENTDILARCLLRKITEITTTTFSKTDYYVNHVTLENIKNFVDNLNIKYGEHHINSISCDLMTIKKVQGIEPFFITKTVISNLSVNYYPAISGYFYFSDNALNDASTLSFVNHKRIYQGR